MFGLAAPHQEKGGTWAKNWLGWCSVPTFLLVFLIFGMCCPTATAQITVTFSDNYTDAERTAVRRAVEYWNDLIDTLNTSIAPREINFVKSSINTGWGITEVEGTESPTLVDTVDFWRTTPRNTQLIGTDTDNIEARAMSLIGYMMGFTGWIDDPDVADPYTMLARRDQNALSRPFLTESELGIFSGLGHDINIGRFFGRSYTGAGVTQTVSDNINLDGMYGVGLHLISGNNTITLDADISTSGYAGTGIRVENNNNTVIINEGTRIIASGENGIGVLMTHNTGSGGSTLLNRGRIDATGPGGTGVYINITNDGSETGNIQAVFDNSGIINAGSSGTAIYISELGILGDRFQVPMKGINFMQGTIIAGDIVNHESNTFQVLTFGKAIDAETGRALDETGGASNAFTIRVDGGLQGRFGIETWGGTTIIERDINIINGGIFAGNWYRGGGSGDFNTSSTLILRGNVSSIEVFQVLSDNTLVAAGNAASGGTTFSPVSGAIVQVFSGGAISPSVDTGDLGLLTIVGNGTLFFPILQTEFKPVTPGTGDWDKEPDSYVPNPDHTGNYDSDGAGGYVDNPDGTGEFDLVPGGYVEKPGAGSFVLHVPGYLTMEDGSTLRVNLGANNQSDQIIVTGTSTITIPDPSNEDENITVTVPSATIGAITIDLTTLTTGTFTLIKGDTLDYHSDSIAVTNDGHHILAQGKEISAFGRKSADASVQNFANTELRLTVDVFETGNVGNYHLTWTGIGDGTTWNVGTTGDPNNIENWRDDAGYSVWFEDGDSITFGLGSTHTLNITPAGGVVVSDMVVEGDGNWTFNGDITGRQGIIITDVADGSTTTSTGRLTMEGTGSLTLNGNYRFEGDITLDGGQYIVDVVDYTIPSQTTVDGGLVTDANLYVGKTGYADLNLRDNGSLTAAENIYLGFDTGAEGTVVVGNNSTVSSINGNIYLGYAADSKGSLTFGNDSIIETQNVYVGGNDTAAQGTGKLALTGNGTIFGNVHVYETGTLDLDRTGGMYNVLTIHGDLTMYSGSIMDSGSTLVAELEHVVNGRSSIIDVTGTARIGAIYLELGSVFDDNRELWYSPFDPDIQITYTLITAGDLIYAPDSATFRLNGRDLEFDEGRWRSLEIHTNNVNNELKLTLSGHLVNYRLDWTGNEGDGLWNYTSENWNGGSNNEGEGDTRFVDGDAIRISDMPSGTQEITIVDGDGTAPIIVSSMVVDTNSNWTINGNILGDGDLTSLDDMDGSLHKLGIGTLILNGDNEFRGGSRVEAGTLNIGGTIKGDIVNQGNVTFNRDVETITFFSDNVSGTGSLTKSGADILVLEGNNIYSGLTRVATGWLLFGEKTNEIGSVSVHAGAALGGFGDNTAITTVGTLDNGGWIFNLKTLDVNGRINNASSGYISEIGTLNATVLNNSGWIWDIGTLTVSNNLTNTGALNADGEFTNGIIDGTGSGPLFVGGTLTNDRGLIENFSTIAVMGRMNNVNGGLVRNIENLEVAGSVRNTGAQSAIYNVENFIIGSTLTNTGTIEAITNLETGSVTNSGTINRIDSMNVIGSVVNSGAIANVEVFNVYQGSVANSGLMTKIGMVYAENNFTNNGIVADIPALTVGGNLANTKYILDVRKIEAQNFQNEAGATIAGVNKIGTNAPFGTFANQGGVLIVGDVQYQRENLTGNGLTDLNIDRNAGRILEPGVMTFTGLNVLTIDSDFENNVGGIVIGVNGTRSSFINVTGSATVNGGNLYLVTEQQNFVPGRNYVFLKAAEGLDIQSALQVGETSDPLFKAVLGNNGSDYWFTFVRTQNYSGVGETMNQRTMGRYMDRVSMRQMQRNLNGDFRQVLMALDNARAGELKRALRDNSALPTSDPTLKALDQMSGSIYGTMVSASFQNVSMFHNMMANVLRRDQNNIRMSTMQGRAEPSFVSNFPQDDYWGMIYGNIGTIHSDGNVGKYTNDFAGFLGGSNIINNQQHRLGFFLNVGLGELKGEVGDKTQMAEFIVGPYYRRDTANTYVRIQFGLGNHYYDTKRRLVFGDPTDPRAFINRTAKSKLSAPMLTNYMEAGLKYRGGVLNISPFVGTQYIGMTRKSVDESGAGSLNLDADQHAYHSLRALFGMRLDSRTFRLYNGMASMYGNVAWVYEFDQICERHTVFTARYRNSGSTFTIRGNDPGRDWVQTGFGLNYDFHPAMRASIGYDAYANTNQVMHSFNLGFVYQR